MAFRLRAERLLAAAVAVIASSFALPAHAARTVYCCEDERGRTTCADILPAVCYGRAYREMSPQGHVRRRVAAPPTASEIAERDAAERRRRDDEARLLKQRRIDQALLQTYTSLDDIDARETRAVDDVEDAIAALQAHETELVAERDRLAASPDGARAAAALQQIDAELASLRAVVEVKRREIDAIRARFANDRRRYAELIAEPAQRP